MQHDRANAGRTSSISVCVSDIKRHTLMLEREKRRDASLTTEGEDRVEDLIESNLGFVVKVASEFRNKGLPFEDLINEGNLGLLRAAGRFDPSRGHHFTTYAVFWIRKSIMNALAEQTRVVRIPAYHRRQQKRLTESVQDAERNCRRRYVPHHEDPYGRGKITPYNDVLLRLSLKEISLDSRIFDEGDLSLADRLVDNRTRSPEETMIGKEIKQLIDDAVENLPDQERKVIRYRFGLDGDRPWVLQQVGDLLGVSRERIRQIEVRAKRRMRMFINRRLKCSGISGRRPPSRIFQSPSGADRRHASAPVRSLL